MVKLIDDVRDYLLVDSEDHTFDSAIQSHIDVAIFSLSQILKETPSFTANSDAESVPSQVRTYIKICTKIAFDPSASSAVSESLNKMKNELEWRLSVETPYS